MFGQQKNTFGTGAATPAFSGFGQSAFAKPANTFGNTFGQQNSSVFGAQPTGLFGSTSQANPQQPSFGSTFGAQQPQQPQSSIFGATSTAGTTSLFGAQQTSTFGAAKPAGFGFGQQQPTSSLFGQTQQPQTSLFGAQPTQNTGATGLFTGAQPAQATGMFGQQQATNQQGGTAIAKFQPQQETDTLLKGSTTSYVQTKQQCITFMKEYADKSLEELRIEDYAANRKGPQGGTGLFGSNQTSNVFGQQQSNTLFGQQPAQQTTGLFGSTANTLGATSGFGTNTSTFGAQNTGNLFGKPMQPTSTATTSSFGGFGNNTTQSSFGIGKPFNNVTPAPSTSFGSPFGQMTSATPNTFGSTFGGQQQSQSLFGTTTSTAPAFGTAGATTGFGGLQTNTTNNLFGATQKPAFGAAAPTFGTSQAQPITSTGFTGFGQPSGGSLFAQKPAPFGFGQPTQQPTSNVSFGANTGGSLFGSNTQPATGGLFGSSNTAGASTGLFGSTQSPFNATSGLNFGSTQPSLFNTQQQNQQQQTGTEIHQKILALTSNPYGDNELFRGLKPSTVSDDALKATNPMAQKALLESSNNFKISPGSVSKIKVKPVSTIVTKKSLFDGLEEYDASLDESFTIKTNAKRLIIKPRSSVGLNRTNDESLVKTRESFKSFEKENDAPETFQNQISLLQPSESDSDRRVSWLRTAPSQTIRGRPNLREASADTTMNQLIQVSNKESDALQNKDDQSANVSLLNETFHSNDDIHNETDISIVAGPYEPHPTGIVLRRSGYYTIPSLDDLLDYMDIAGHCKVPNFTIGRRGYGNVYFDEEIDVAGLNLDEICHFRNKEIILYQDDDNKPPVGEGLNRKAQVTLDQIWPHDKTTHDPIKDVARLEAMGYEAKLRRICEKRKTKFLEYRPETGSCVFKVDHFSKYTLDDSDDEGAEGEPRTDPKKAKIIPPVVQNGKKTDFPKDKGDKTIDPSSESFLRMKQQETSFILGPHMGQRGFLQQSFPIDIDESTSPSDPKSPSITLAKEMRTDTHKLQLMKASFFVEDDYDAQSVISDATEGRESPDQMVPNHKSKSLGTMLLSRTIRSFDEEMPAISSDGSEKITNKVEPKRQELIQKQIFKSIGPKTQPLVVRPRIMLYDISDISLPTTNSILNVTLSNKNNTVPFFNGRKFKIGWNHGNELTVVNSGNTNANSLFKGRNRTDLSKSVLKILQFKSMDKKTNESFEKSIIDHLKIELKYDKRIPNASSECHRLEASGGTIALQEHYEIAQKLAKDSPNETNTFNFTVWSLIQSLWGSIDGELLQSTDHATVMIRRDLLSSWLQNVITNNDVLKSNLNYLDRLMNLMMCHKVSDACDLALENNDINLSLLIAQSSGGPSVRQLVQHQLCCWHEVEADEYIDEKRLRILMMIGGISAMDGACNSLINIYENHNWLKCLALQLWYISSPIASVTDTILSYEQNFLNENANVAAPIPPYKNQSENTKYYDIRFHLLKLYSQRSYPLECLLNPANYSKDLMDYRLSFFVLQVLKTLGYHHLSDSCRFKVYNCVAEQLETNGLWEWAIWVMLHIEDDNHRESAIHKLLYRYIRIDDELDNAYSTKEKFLLEDLSIPEKWIFWAKAVRAKALNNYQVELKYLLKAQQWSKAHGVMMQYIAPDLLINDQIDYLKSLLLQFANTNEIQNWKTQGEILLHFIELNESFTSLTRAENIDEELFLERIRPKLSDLCSVIRLFPCPTSKHRLCQCEIAKQLAFVIRNFYATSTTYGNQASALMRTALERLPLPQEFAQHELKHILATFLMEKLTTN